MQAADYQYILDFFIIFCVLVSSLCQFRIFCSIHIVIYFFYLGYHSQFHSSHILYPCRRRYALREWSTTKGCLPAHFRAWNVQVTYPINIKRSHRDCVFEKLSREIYILFYSRVAVDHWSFNLSVLSTPTDGNRWDRYFSI